MHQDSWLHPNLADGWSAWASDTSPAAKPEPRSRVALDAAAAKPAADDGDRGVARVSRAIPLSGAGPDMWGDAARLTASASVARTVIGAGQSLPPAAPPVPSAAHAARTAAARGAKPASERPHSAGPKARPRLFEFIGQGALSVTSSITGKHYRFTEHGAQLAVDPRDWSQLSRVPSLRAVV